MWLPVRAVLLLSNTSHLTPTVVMLLSNTSHLTPTGHVAKQHVSPDSHCGHVAHSIRLDVVEGGPVAIGPAS
jgi:hypothetical protein